MTSTERVLCIKRNALPLEWVSEESVIATREETFFTTCQTAGIHWVERPLAEMDSSFKQIIPYILIQSHNREKTAVYRRQGSEKRLHDLWSIGIGGHINPVDINSGSNTFQAILETGMERELEEELLQRPADAKPRFLGTINEERTEVGSVHFGAVFVILTSEPESFVPGEELASFRWVPTAELSHMNLELWSSLALKLLQGTV